MSADFAIPAAVDSGGALVRPECGETGGSYACPSCRSSVVWRRPSAPEKRRVRSHFAHRPDPSNACTSESVAHKLGKLFVVEALNEHRAGKRLCPLVRSRCRTCGSPRDIPLPWPTEDARAEHRLPSGRVVDVWAGSFAVEVFRSHAVDAEKAEALARDRVEWWELEAGPLADDPQEWISTVGHLARDCAVCARAARDRADEGKREALAEKAQALESTEHVRKLTLAAKAELDRVREELREKRKLALRAAPDAVRELATRLDAEAASLAARKADILAKAEKDAAAIREKGKAFVDAELALTRGQLERDAAALEVLRRRLDAKSDVLAESEAGLLVSDIDKLATERARLQQSVADLRTCAVLFRTDGTKVSRTGNGDAVFLYPTADLDAQRQRRTGAL